MVLELTTIPKFAEEPESDMVDPDAYDPEDNFVMDVPRVVYSPPKASSNIVEVPTSDKPSTEEASQKAYVLGCSSIGPSAVIKLMFRSHLRDILSA